MISYAEAVNLAIVNTIPDGKVYYSGDAGDFYIFIIVEKDFPMNIRGAMFGTTFTAVDKEDGRVWTISIGDERLKNVKKIVSRR